MYGEKYYHEYCDIHGDVFRISLQELDYTGTPVWVECGTEQFVIDRENPKSLAMGGVYPKRATAVFVSDAGFDLEELYTANEKTYLLVRYKNGAVNWRGNVVSDGFSRGTWDLDRERLTVKASDNLAILKGIPFTDSLGENYGNDGFHIKSFLWAIKEGLKKTGFNLNIWTMVDLKHKSADGEDGNFYTIQQASVSSANHDRLNIEYVKEPNRQERNASRDADYDKIVVGSKVIVRKGFSPIDGYEGVVLSKSIWNSFYTSGIYIEVSPPMNTSPMYPVELQFQVQSDSANTPDPLLTEHDVRVWIRDSNVEGKTYYEARGGAMSTWEVLDAIARQWNVIIQQNENHWEVKRWNADKLPDGEYEWFVYNSEGTPIGRQPFGGDVLLPCRPTQTEYRIFGSTLSMDRVLRNVIVNYKYKYKQDGDSLLNLIGNPNFSQWMPDWIAIRNPAGRLLDMEVSQYTGSTPIVGVNTGVTVSNLSYTQWLAARDQRFVLSDRGQVNEGDQLKLSWFESYYRVTGPASWQDVTLYQIDIWARQDIRKPNTQVNDPNMDRYMLVLSGMYETKTEIMNGIPVERQKYKANWEKWDKDRGDIKFGAIFTRQKSLMPGPDLGWRLIEVEAPKCPINGFINFEIYGGATTGPATTNNNIDPKDLKTYSNAVIKAPSSGTAGTETVSFADKKIQMSLVNGRWKRVTVTGITVNKIVDPSNDAVPQIDPFMYPDFESQRTRDYTDTIDEIEVLTGDDYGEYTIDRISGMSISGQPTTMWDSWDNRYGWSRQGLVTAKSVIELYWKPTRLINAEISLKGLHWSSRIQFEELPGKRFVILSGSIGGPRSTFKGVLKEVHDNADVPLPPGGNDGDSTTNPNWQSTGLVRCIRDENGLNTGEAEEVQVDTNRASPTYGQEKWVGIGETDTCPVGEGLKLFWGEQAVLDVNALRTYPFTQTGDVYSVQYSNNDSNVYLRFLHRTDLGTVRSITYDGGFESISGWEYEPDVTIGGYTYKSMRLTWFVGVFSGLNVNFEIN